jgi:hypothetical protein
VSGFFHVILKYPIPSGSQTMCGDANCANITGPPPCAAGQTRCAADLPLPGIQGGQTIASVYAPTPDPQGHSLAQTWTFSGANVSDFAGCHACTFDCTQTVEVGWTMDPFYETQNVNSPHLFVYSTQDGYWNTGAYAPNPAPKPNCDCEQRLGADCNACLNTVPNPWVGVTFPGLPQFTPGMSVFAPSQIGQKPPKEVLFSTLNDGAGAGWWVLVNGSPIGFYPSKIFQTAHPPQVGSLANTASSFWAGGEVASAPGTSYTPSSPAMGLMGSGIGAPIGFGASAYHRNVEYFIPGTNGNVTTISTAFFNLEATDQNCYNYGAGLAGLPLAGPAPGASNWNNWLYYGGLGHNCGSFWSGFPGSCDACCTFVPSNVLTSAGTCPATLSSSTQQCDSSCLQPPAVQSGICGGG